MPNPLSMIPIVDKVLSIIEDWQKSRPINKLRYRLEAAIEYILLDEKSGEYIHYDEKRIKQYKSHFKKRVLDE